MCDIYIWIYVCFPSSSSSSVAVCWELLQTVYLLSSHSQLLCVFARSFASFTHSHTPFTLFYFIMYSLLLSFLCERECLFKSRMNYLPFVRWRDGVVYIEGGRERERRRKVWEKPKNIRYVIDKQQWMWRKRRDDTTLRIEKIKNHSQQNIYLYILCS